MSIAERFHELQRRTSISHFDALHAPPISRSDLDVERAVGFLRTPRSVTKSLRVCDSTLAARLAAGLIATGLWFECRQLDHEKWHFAVATEVHARLLALHEALLCSKKSYERVTLKSLLLLEAGGRTHS